MITVAPGEAPKNGGGAVMGEVVHAKFGTEREWQETRARLRDGLVTLGALFGDDPELMQAKADVAYHALRQIVEDLPKLNISSRLPNELTDEGLLVVREELRLAALAGVSIAMEHSVAIMTRSIYDLCTSKLAKR